MMIYDRFECGVRLYFQFTLTTKRQVAESQWIILWTIRVGDRKGMVEIHRNWMADDTLRMQCYEGEQQYTSLQVSHPFCPYSGNKTMVFPSCLFPTCSTPSCGSFHLQGLKWHISKKNRDVLVNLVVQWVEKKSQTTHLGHIKSCK